MRAAAAGRVQGLRARSTEGGAPAAAPWRPLPARPPPARGRAPPTCGLLLQQPPQLQGKAGQLPLHRCCCWVGRAGRLGWPGQGWGANSQSGGDHEPPCAGQAAGVSCRAPGRVKAGKHDPCAFLGASQTLPDAFDRPLGPGLARKCSGGSGTGASSPLSSKRQARADQPRSAAPPHTVEITELGLGLACSSQRLRCSGNARVNMLAARRLSKVRGPPRRFLQAHLGHSRLLS